jgi:tRNA(Ile)-lysidine synthase TilS/MesJ
VTGPPVATATCRVAVRRCLTDHDGPVLAAVSGGADSLALAAALAFERPGSGALVVDHCLQPGSAAVAARAAAQCESLGLHAQVLTAPPRADHGPRPGDHGGAAPSASVARVHELHDRRGNGPEAHARELRYALLEEAAAMEDGQQNAVDRPGQDRVDPPRSPRAGCAVVLLGHTREDQAESVLLGLVRGSGARALSGMAPVRGRYRRPFLDVPRAVVRQACAEAGLEPHQDPHNEDPAYLRVAVRKLLSDLDVVDGLARSAALLREDADALDALAVVTDDVAVLAALPAAVRSRSLKAWAERQSGRAVTSTQVTALRALVEDWHGQGPVALPGGGQVTRAAGRLAFRP